MYYTQKGRDTVTDTSPATLFSQQQERAAIRRNANAVGFFLLALLAGQTVVSILIVMAQLSGWIAAGQDNYGLDNTAYLLVQMIQYLLCTIVPVMVAVLIMRRWDNPFPTHRVPRGTYGIAVFGGMAVAALANLMADYIINFLVSLGVPMPQFPETVEPTLISLLLNVVSVAVLPALVEEMIFRGYILHALRPHGDVLAVTVTAVLFGLIHGNILQVPFAMVLGWILGWLTVQTNSIWPAVALHGVNNLMAVLLEWLQLRGWIDDNFAPVYFTALFVLGGSVWLVAFVKKPSVHEDWLRPMDAAPSVLTRAGRIKAVLTAPALLIGGIPWLAILLMSMFVG